MGRVHFQLTLVSGVTQTLDVYPLKPGHYTQIRLILAIRAAMR
jgi:hypothetical protein